MQKNELDAIYYLRIATLVQEDGYCAVFYKSGLSGHPICGLADTTEWAFSATMPGGESFQNTEMMKSVTGSAPKMWGPSIVGFGQYHYKYESGHEGYSCLTGFSPRKGNLTLYVLAGFTGQEALLKKLGKHKASKGCLYIKKLEDVDMTMLEKIVKGSVDFLKKKYPAK